MGYRLAGFRMVVQVEQECDRAAIGRANFPGSKWISKDIRKCHEEIATEYRSRAKGRRDLLVATPPCQGMSSSNPSRGKRRTPKAALQESKNKLLMEIIPTARSLRPRVIVSENVRQILTHHVQHETADVRLLDALANELPDYTFYETVVDVADYGIPQRRFRAVVVGVHGDEPWREAIRQRGLSPWPRPTHSGNGETRRTPWIPVRQWLESIGYSPLSSRSPEEAVDGHPLHFVPHYDENRFRLVSDIPPHSGRSAYESEACPSCRFSPVPPGAATCPACRKPMHNRPIVTGDGEPRLIKGFASSYRRMRSGAPAPTVTTNSSHVGSDNKIHPWEPRVLSILEAADLQTVPRFFNWSPALDAGRTYLVRNVIGEAFPTYFAYLHGQLLRGLLEGRASAYAGLAKTDAAHLAQL